MISCGAIIRHSFQQVGKRRQALLHNDKNISTSVARNVKWARGTEVHSRQPENKGAKVPKSYIKG